MNQIKSLADELRETIKKDGNGKSGNQLQEKRSKNQQREQNREGIAGSMPDELFENILAFELDGNEKLLIRLNDKTIFLLKQLKIAKSIDMNKLIAYSLQDFLNRHPELIQYVKQNIKTIEL